MGATLKELLAEARSEIELITPAQLVARLEHEGALVIDVREAGEFDAEHLPGALNVSRSFLEVKADTEHPAREPQLAERDSPVVTYCTGGIGARSILAAQTLRRMGFERVACLEGGLEAWKQDGQATEP